MEERGAIAAMDDGATTVDGRITSTSTSTHKSGGGRRAARGHGRQDSALSHCSTLSGLSTFSMSMIGGGGSSDTGTLPSRSDDAAGASSSSPSKMSTPPGTPNRSKLRAEYHARISSPTKRRMQSSPGDSPFSSPSSASKRANSPLSLRKSMSEGDDYGDRFVPARRSAQMEIAYSLLEDGDDDCHAFLHSTSPFASRPGGLFSSLGSPSSSSSLGRFGLGLLPSSPSLSAAGTGGAAAAGPSASSSTAMGMPGGMPPGAGSTAAAAAAAAAAGAGNTGGAPTGGGEAGGREGQTILNMLLKTELLGVESSSRPSSAGAGGATGDGACPAAAAAAVGWPPAGGETRGAWGGPSSSTGAAGGGAATSSSRCPLTATSPAAPTLLAFKSKSPRERHWEDMTRSFSLVPVGATSRRLLSTPRQAQRKISKVPHKVLDAPGIQDDFYLQMVDWSALNVLAVGLGACVYLWSACTSKVTKLCDLGQEDCVTSVAWTQRGTHLAVGTNQGEVQIWDASRCQRVRTMAGHSARVGTMSWNAQQVLASGSRDRLICLRDVRQREPSVARLQAHRQEVCGLRWSFDDMQLASGGNDNKLYIWSLEQHGHGPVQRFTDHTAAVKAIAWSPHQNGLLASGGGTADRCIRFWNTLTGAAVSAVDTGSQVCNLMWSRTVNEIVSTHGYSLNQIILWRYPSMAKVATLTGHTYRVLYLAMSPDGQTIVTGAGDETLRFWSAFPGSTKSTDGSRLGASLLFPSGHDIR